LHNAIPVYLYGCEIVMLNVSQSQNYLFQFFGELEETGYLFIARKEKSVGEGSPWSYWKNVTLRKDLKQFCDF